VLVKLPYASTKCKATKYCNHYTVENYPVFRIRIKIHRIRPFLGLLDPDPSINKKKKEKEKTLISGG
jgi:hypothetical protein